MNTIASGVVTGAKSAGPLTDQSVAKQLLFGSVLEENLFPYPAINERDREVLGMIVESIDRFLDGKDADFARWDREARQPDEFVQSLRELGLFGLIIPEEFGGLGLSNAAYARVLAQTSSYDSSVSLTIGAHSSIGMKGLLLFGNADQKSRYLPRLATGEMIAAFCLTESGAGSDAAAIRTTAKRNADGSFTLNGEKLWITNGGIADFYTVFARTDGPEGKVTAFIVEAAWPGVSHGAHEDKMGIRASCTTTVAFNDVRVPAENVLGDVGKGFKVAMGILNNGRTGLGGGAVGGMKALIRRSVAQALERKQFDRPIARVRSHPREDRADDGRMLCRRERGVDGGALHRQRLRRLLRGGSHHQGLRQRSDAAHGLRKPADRGRQRLHARAAVRAVHARCAHPADLRRHQRDPAPLYRAGIAQGRRRVAEGTAIRGQLHLQRSDQGLRRPLGLCGTPLFARHRRGRGGQGQRAGRPGVASARRHLRELRARDRPGWPRPCCGNTARASRSASTRSGGSRIS